jgi:kynurenine formamidase
VTAEACPGGPLAELLRSCSNAGRWGPADERGTLNYIDRKAVLRGIRTCSEGDVVALATMPAPASVAGDSTPLALRVWQGAGLRDALDSQCISPHGFEVTHLDALGHSFYEGAAYNGRRMEDIVDRHGLRALGIESMAGGVVTRGVLLDILRVRGNEVPQPAEEFSAEDLSLAAGLSGTEVLPGDAVLVRSGVPAGPPGPDGRRAGLGPSAVRWLYDQQVALYGGDCIERLPGGGEPAQMVLHQVGHVAMGLAILDNPDVEGLRRACDRHGRQEFLFVVAPVPIRGATGCAVNPLAVF